MRSNYSRTKLSRLDFFKFRTFTFADACGHQFYITYIHYISYIKYVLKIVKCANKNREGRI